MLRRGLIKPPFNLIFETETDTFTPWYQKGGLIKAPRSSFGSHFFILQ